MSRIVVALVLALAVGEAALRTVFAHSYDAIHKPGEPRRQAHPVLGWVNAPERIGHARVGNRVVDYVIDRRGDRISAPGHSPDPERPTIICAGESYMFGYDLPYDETMPAQIAQLSGIQAANIAIEGYALDQAYLRLEQKLPQFSHPVAVVQIFLPSVFKKMLDSTRPHLDRNLRWVPPHFPFRLRLLAHWLFPYDSTERIDEAVAAARAVLHAADVLARSRGAVVLTIVPRYLPEDPGEAWLRERVLDDSGLPYLMIDLPRDWHAPRDQHPDGRADRAMAEQIVQALRRSGALQIARN